MIATRPAASASPVRVRVRVSSATLRAVAVTLALTGSLLPGVGGLNLAAIGLALAVAFALVELLRSLPKLHPVLTSTVALFTLLSVSLLWTDPPNAYGAAKLTALLTTTLLSALIAATIRDHGDLSRLALVWPVVMLPIAIDTLVAFDGGRAGAFDENPIWVARALATGLICLTWRLWAEPVRARPMLTLGSMALLTGAIVATGSRGPLLGLVAGVLILTLVKAHGRPIKIAALALAGAVVGYVMRYTDFFASTRLVEALSEGDLADSNGRDELLAAALAIVRAHPAGVGIGNISAMADFWWWRHTYPHNIFVEVLAEHGVVVGSLFILVTAVTLLRLLVRARRDDAALLLAALLAAEIVNVSFSGDLNARSFFFMLMLALWVLFRITHLRPPLPAPAGPRSASRRHRPAPPPSRYRRRTSGPSARS